MYKFYLWIDVYIKCNLWKQTIKTIKRNESPQNFTLV